MHNRSVPVDTVLPHLDYRNLDAAIEWLRRAFGFTEHYRYGNPLSGAQLFAGSALIMAAQRQDRFGPQCLTIFLDDVDAHYARAKAAGASIVEEPHETVYGEYQYAALDPEGHRWIFSRHARDLAPEEWGATSARSQNRG